ncbi:hypothetical protein PENSTE_c011G04104 [Penicillium steckii]|uniref:Uncharacterized protein n=1 Tax=Penicillium steckii TaxID=303698 RepID=A0A1V6T841_9EURO|nr:hypothetical protein PENSTE_c011G04104 [Penicillium steckii]
MARPFLFGASKFVSWHFWIRQLALLDSPVGTSGFASWYFWIRQLALWIRQLALLDSPVGVSGFASWFTTSVIWGVLYRYSGGPPARITGATCPYSGGPPAGIRAVLTNKALIFDNK